MAPFSLCPPVPSDIQALLSFVTGISERRGSGACGGVLVKDRKQKKGSFQEATNDLIYPFSGTMKPLMCQPMKRPWCWNHRATPKSWINRPPTAVL